MNSNIAVRWLRWGADRTSYQMCAAFAPQLLGVLATLLYLCTIPGNQLEAEDGLSFAYDIETKPYPALLHRYHLGFLPFMKLVYSMAHAAGLADRSLPALLAVNAVAAGAGVTLFLLLLRERFNFRTDVAALGALGLALSYGFWRYAAAADSYAIASCLAIALLYLALRPAPTARDGVALSLVASAALLMHTFNMFPACILVPLVLLTRRRWAALSVYFALSTVILTTAYACAAYVERMSLAQYLFSASELGTDYAWSAVPKSVIGFGQGIMAGAFMFGIPGFADWLGRIVPSMEIRDDVFTAVAACRVVLFAGTATAVIVAALAVASVFKRLTQSWRGINAAAGLGALWLVLYAALAAGSNPATAEMWLMALVPFWLILTALFVEPLCQSGARRLVAAFVLALGLHNYVGGLLIFSAEASNYYLARSAWLLRNTTAQDVIVTYDKDVLTRHLRYYGNAIVVNLYWMQHDSDVGPLRAQLAGTSGHIYVLDDVVEPPSLSASLARTHAVGRGLPGGTTLGAAPCHVGPARHDL